MEVIAMAVATFFNITILRWKYKRKRYQDLAIDIAILVGLVLVCGNSQQGLATATVVSFMISIYLLIFPPKIGQKND